MFFTKMCPSCGTKYASFELLLGMAEGTLLVQYLWKNLKSPYEGISRGLDVRLHESLLAFLVDLMHSCSILAHFVHVCISCPVLAHPVAGHPQQVACCGKEVRHQQRYLQQPD